MNSGHFEHFCVCKCLQFYVWKLVSIVQSIVVLGLENLCFDLFKAFFFWNYLSNLYIFFFVCVCHFFVVF